ncbi:type I restriction-modification system specificty subunit [Prevotella sp. CAG:5226]|nr:type I restriction-modification system specificty subunit [Prevotella sp. CAG:5226]
MKETKFKDTEIGKIPEEWEVKKLGAVFDIGNGRDYKHLNTGKIPVYGTGGLMTYVNEYLYDGETVCIGRKGTINMPQYHNGKIWTVDTLFYTYNFRKTDVKFLYYLTQRIDWNSYNTATGVPSLTSQNISNILVSFPPLHEQHRIASALTSIDNLISSLGKQIEKKKNIKQGAMQQLLTGKTRLKGFSELWVKRKLGDNATIQRGGSPRPIEAYLTTNRDGINWIKIGDVRPNDKFIRHTVEKIIPEGVSHSRQVYKGDFILSNSMSFGRPYILDIDGCIHDGWLVIKDYSNTYDMDFLYYILSSDTVFEQYIAMAAGSSVKNLNKEKVANVMLFAPQSLAEQRAIATILNKMDNEITALETKKAKYEAIKQGMMQQLLTGKIRLIS